MIFTFPIIVSLIPAGITLVMVIIGFILWKKVSRITGVLIIGFGFIFLGIFGPLLFTDRVELSNEQIQQTTGFWFDLRVKGFEFSGLKQVLIGAELDRNNRYKEVWIAEYTSGKTVKIDPGDLWESNGEQIVQFMENNGIIVIRE